MDARTVTRQAVDTYLTVVKLPVDLAAQYLIPADAGRTDAQRFVDRIDAEVRDLLGRLLHDDEFRADAGRRRAASSGQVQTVRSREHVAPLRVAEPDRVEESAPDDPDAQRRREDRIEDLEVAEESLEERAAALMAEEEVAQVAAAAERAEQLGK